MEKDMFDACAN